MALLSMLTGALGLGGGPQRTDIGGVILVDATIKEDPTYESEVTMHPVEDGLDVTDHIHVKNDKLTIEGVISESPLNLASQLTGFVTGAGAALGSKFGQIGSAAGGIVAGGVGATLFGNSDNPADIAYDALLGILKDRQIITIVTKTDRYENMVMTNLQFPVDNTTGKSLHFTATFQEIRIVSADLITLPPVANAIKTAAGAKAKRGRQGSKTAGAKESILHSAAFGGLIKAGGLF